MRSKDIDSPKVKVLNVYHLSKGLNVYDQSKGINVKITTARQVTRENKVHANNSHVSIIVQEMNNRENKVS